MHKVIFACLFLISVTGFTQATLQQSFPQELFTEGMDMMAKSEFGSARQYFERYLETDDTKYKERAEYNVAKCALSLYHLDGETLINKYIREYPSSQMALMAHFELGIYFFQDRDYKKAAVQFEEVNANILDKSLKEELTYKLGYSYFAQRKFDKAIGYFNNLKTKKGTYQILSAYYAGFIEFGKEDYDVAIEDLKLAAYDPNFSNSVALMLASVYYKKGDYKELINYLVPLVEQNETLNKNTQISIFLGEAYFYTNQYKIAIEFYQKGIRKLNKEASYNYAVCLSKTARNKEATEILKLIAGGSTQTEIAASYLLGNLYLKENEKLFSLGAFLQIDNVENKEIAEESKFLAASLSFQLGRYSQSIEILKDFSTKYPNSIHSTDANTLLAKALVQTNDYPAAISYIEELPQKSTEAINAYQKATFHLGVEQFNNRKFRLAVANFKKSFENGTDRSLRVKAHLYTGEAYALGRRYSEAEVHYKYVLSSGFSEASKEVLLARFGLGYVLYNQEKYASAKSQFGSFISAADKKNAKYGRALVRLADCEYVSKNYETALNHYNRAVKGVFREKDYAYYQLGVIYHIQSKYDLALTQLERVTEVYKSSPYLDDAVFEMATIHLETGMYDKAIGSFSNLITEHPRSKYVPYALEKRALSNFNKKEYARTVADYELFLKKYPYHPSIQNVLLGLQQSYSLDGKATNFNATFNRFKNANPDIEGLEVVEFDAIKGYYNEGQYAKSEEGFKGFISNYPSDLNIPEAKFILAESLFRQNKNKEALSIYYQIVNDHLFELMYRVFERIADLEYENNNYSKSIEYYHLLNKSAISPNQQFRSISGLMKAHYYNSSYDSVFVFANNLLEADGARNEFLVASHLFQGKAFFAKGDYENAILEFEKTTAIANDESGAESQYLIGEIKYLSGEFDASNEVLYEVAQKYGNYDEWLDKSFLLIADNFVAKKEDFQAKATLQSIIENASSKTTKSQAEQRLKELVIKEQGRVLNTDTLSIVVNDSIPNE
jgi:TolA-binding protein